MSQDNLNLEIGDILQLEFVLDERGVRYSVRVIGVLPRGSILVTTPERNGKLMSVREGQVIIARSFSRDFASAFSTRVIRACTHPYPYLHLSYPDAKEEVVVRNARRARVMLAATVSSEREPGRWTNQLAAMVNDVSTTGAMLETSTALGRAGTAVKILFSLPIEGVGEQQLVVEGKIRTVHEDSGNPDRLRYGVEFAQLDAMGLLTLRAFVYEQLLSAGR
jgi:c-di-GMP-binding flagellar brake protein YcgR